MAIEETILERATDWAVRTGDPNFQDWEAFTLWLEQDPAHARAYDEVCAAVTDAAQVVSAAPANDDAVRETGVAPHRRHRWLGAALAASVAVIAMLAFQQRERRDLYRVETAGGQMRTIALGEHSRVQLAGGTVIELDRDDPRFARLDQGQALFTVRHDAAHPFRVAVGEERLVDVGTVFDVRRDDGGVSVAVSEGAVQFNPERENLRVSPGQVLRKSRHGSITFTRIAPAQVGEWRDGRLTFSEAPLEQVAADLSRATGIHFVVAPGVEALPISGSISVSPSRNDPKAVGALLGLPVRADGDRWIIGSQ